MTQDPFLEQLFLRRGGGNTPEDYLAFSTLRNHPQKSFASVHIAGSNGKGSVATKIAAGLQAAGKKVGLFTSPHLLTFEERITINGRRIPREEVITRGQEIAAMGPHLNFFEVITFMAFEYFRDDTVEIAVVETGIGGAFDVTNILHPKLSVITSISLEHTDILGDTLEAIARDKAQIIKPGVPAVIGPAAALDPIASRGRAVGSALTFVEPVEGPFDSENQAIARGAMGILDLPLECIEIGCQKRAACRFEERGNAILDVAHNPASFHRLGEALAYYYPGQKFPFVIGICGDKDAEGCLRAIAPVVEKIIAVPTHSTRSLAPEKLAAIAVGLGFQVEIAKSIKGVKTTTNKTVICGSFYLMEEAIMVLNLNQACAAKGMISAFPSCELNTSSGSISSENPPARR
ncbi:MAG: Folylpolyglutamate synthase [Chlamydiae bacterium]|nr:Folylpolyglutamate synthase [Chlamydiota bacterium]